MKFYISFLILFFISLSSYAQIDSENNGFAIPAVESEDPKDDPELIIEPAPEAEEAKPDDNNDNEIEAPKEVVTAVKPKVAFSIYKEENNFRSSAEVFTKQLDRQMNSVEERLLLLPADTNQFLGNYTTSAKKLNIQYRDFGAPDGDLIRVIINDDVVVLKEMLTTGFKGFNIDFDEGIFRIEFQALNQGLSGPNTAELRIFDENNNIIISNQWNLRTGRKAIIVLAKSEESKLQLIEQSVDGDEESKDATTKADKSKSTSSSREEE
ncbi:hypothetical protein [Olleya sp. HaHaR_3_96]|uniref:hypothetical protein n=1 Tax=Olleya sp. HaHaR_3_96 TaxID=2745560 RepID=UPI001C4E8FB2|nr:hypothetical protein [Olleya sp. HaHaR_3_96]QXP58710.1 hypothetical protein H0I26_12390 [Olleya sp. HaHaR_3_96]